MNDTKNGPDTEVLEKNKTVNIQIPEKSHKTIKPSKPTAFMMYDLFCRNVPYANIDGSIHLFIQEKGYYCPVDQHSMYQFLLNNFYYLVEQAGSLRIAKVCAELIMQRKLIEIQSAEKCMLVCFQNGYLPIGDIENTRFIQYVSGGNVYPTYLINLPCCHDTYTHLCRKQH